MNIVNFIPFGKENAIPRWKLANITNLTDRMMRREIAAARRNGEIIINDQDGRGYYRDNTPETLKRQYKQNKHRAMSILVQQKHIRQQLKEYGETV